MEYQNTMQKIQMLNNPQLAQNKITELTNVIQSLNVENAQLKEKVAYLEDKIKQIIQEKIQSKNK